ncbi:MAG: hypothetical protein MJ215_00475 [Spirochaetia bacterium]|nr:hypothetical protein [Spirochaetia bacterium]
MADRKNFRLLKLWLSLIFFLCGLVLSAEEGNELQEAFDSIFEDPQEDVVIEKPVDIDYKQQAEKSDKVRIGGYLLMRGGGGIGWDEKPLQSKPEKEAGAYSKAYVTFDITPDPTLQLFGKLQTELESDKGNDTWGDIEADELWCDYNLKDMAFFRFGKCYMKWGQGRLFRPGDFMDDCEDGTSLRASFPNMLDGVSLVILYKNRHKSNPVKKLRRDDLTYAGKVDKTIGDINFTFAATSNREDGQRFLGSIKTVVFGTDFLADGIINYDGETTYEALAGFYKEWSKPNESQRIKLYGEYYFDGRDKNELDNCFGLATSVDNLFGSPVGFGLKWLHSMQTESGQFIAGLTISPWKHIKFRFAVPWNYGDKELDKDFYEEFPIKTKLGFTLFIELTSKF